MKLYYNKNKYIEINNENNNEYIVLTNVEDFKLEAVKLCIFYLNLKQDIIITNAYNIFGNELYDMYGIYINKRTYDENPKIYDTFLFTLLKFYKEFEKQTGETLCI